MVQVIQTSNPKGRLSEMLGMSLGQGLGQGINTYFANKAIDDVMKDHSMKESSMSAKMGKLQSALSPYGELGQNLFNQRMQIEQQEQQEKSLKQQQKLGLEKEQRQYQQQSELQEQKAQNARDLQTQKDEAALERVQNKPNAPLGGLGGTPLTPEESKVISDIIRQNSDASAEELELSFNEAGINPGRTGKILESRRRSEEQKAKTEAESKKIAAKEDIHFHEESKDYVKSLEKEAKIAKKQIQTIEDIEQDVKEGKIKPTSLASIFRGFGAVGEKISNALLSKEQAKILAAVPEFLEGRKELFGVRLSDADLKLMQDKLPDMAKSPEANLQIFGIMKKYAQRSILKQKTAKDVLEKEGLNHRGGKLRPLNYEQKVEENFDKTIDEEENGVKMRTPDGRNITVPLKDLEKALKLKAVRR